MATKQTIAVLLGYLTCTDPVIKTKYENLLASFWHKDEGLIITSVEADGSGGTNIIFSDTNVVNFPALPTSKPISFITGLLDALNAKVDTIVGKQLSTEDFTTAFKTKLQGLSNYVHPTQHLISEVQDLQTTLDAKVDKVPGKGLSTNDLTDALLTLINSAIQPVATPVLDADYVLRNNTWVEKSISTQYAPYFESLVPDSNSPSATFNVVLNGAFFTPIMTVAIAGQTINSINFISDNKVILNITTGATEGSFAITLNNGTGNVVFNNALLIVLGTVFKPIQSEWTDKSLGLDVFYEATAKITVYNSFVYGIWSHEIDITKNVSIRFSPEVSPLGDMAGVLQAKQFSLIKISDNSELFSSNIIGAGTNSIRNYWYSVADSWGFEEITNNISYLDSFIELGTKSTYEYRLINGVMYFYINNVLKHTFTDALTENLKIKVYIKNYDYKNIKYIELT